MRKVGLWANSPQRVSSYLPLARAVADAGHACTFFHGADFAIEPADRAWLAGVETAPVRPEAAALQTGFDVFFSSEAVWRHVPRDGVKVAVFHSLPDRHVLKTNYGQWLKGKPEIVANFDYVVAAVDQGSSWTVENYQPHVAAARDVKGAAGLADFGVIPGGYPKTSYLDKLLNGRGARDRIIYCPTISTNAAASVLTHGGQILATLHAHFPEHQIVFRPYPTDGRDVVDQVMAKAGVLDRIHIDRSLTGAEHQKRAAFVVTDKSSAAISFSICAGRPSLFLELNETAPALAETAIGYTVNDLEGLAEAGRRSLAEAARWKREIKKARSARLYRPFDACAYLASQIETIAEGRSDADWISIPRGA